MDPVGVLQCVLFVALSITALLQYRQAGRRSNQDVYADLVNDSGDAGGESKARPGAGQERIVLDDKLAKIGLFHPQDRRRYLQRRRLVPIAGGLLALLASVAAGTDDPFVVVIGVGCGAGLFDLAARKRMEWQAARFVRRLEFFLPIVMERLVMAVQAGHDIVSGLRTIIEIERKNAEKLNKEKGAREPVTELLAIAYRLATKGARFDQAVKSVALTVDSPAFRHALLHLGLAHKDGGELIGPLRELSDSTQNYYQETVEEEIAKMPVKATMPLLCMFLGLVISFLVNPLVAVLNALTSFQTEM